MSCWACIVTSVVSPVPSALELLLPVREKPADWGATAIPAAIASSTVSTPARSWVAAPIPRREDSAAVAPVRSVGAVPAARSATARRRAAMATLAEEIMSGMKAARTTAPTIDTSARTHEGRTPAGRVNNAMHRFATVTR